MCILLNFNFDFLQTNVCVLMLASCTVLLGLFILLVSYIMCSSVSVLLASSSADRCGNGTGSGKSNSSSSSNNMSSTRLVGVATAPAHTPSRPLTLGGDHDHDHDHDVDDDDVAILDEAAVPIGTMRCALHLLFHHPYFVLVMIMLSEILVMTHLSGNQFS